MRRSPDASAPHWASATASPARKKARPRPATVWCQHELNAVYERAGGTVTTRTVQRTTHGGESTWDATEITVTVDLPGIGPVEAFTDWYEEYGGHDLPLMQAIPNAHLIAA